MNVVDSSGWIEAVNDGPNAGFFKPVIRDLGQLIVPTVSIFEVYRVTLRQHGEDAAAEALDMMTAGQVVELDVELAASAAAISHAEKLAMADAIILATARRYSATVWTQDVDLKRFDNVKFRDRRKSS